ncbi:hypothetical protein EDD11_006005 [Mortierella claussenii]|nr:hypothetical protein EDD11_006005 [Mortierella claussenii]
MTINDDKSNTAVWHDWQGKLTQLNTNNLVPSTMALGYGSASAMVLAAVSNDNILKWTLTTNTTPGLASLSELGIPSAGSISSMTMSSGMGSSSVWIYFTDKGSKQQLLRINLDNKLDRSNTSVASNQVLIPLADSNGVTLLGVSTGGGPENTLVSYFLSNGTTYSKSITTETNALQNDVFIVRESSISQVNPAGPAVSIVEQSPPTPVVTPRPTLGDPLPPTSPAPPQGQGSNQLPVIIGSVVGALALAAIITALLLFYRGKKSRRAGMAGKRGIFTKKQRSHFPVKADESMVPLGLYHQDRSLPQVPHLLENDLERLGYTPRQGDSIAQVKSSTLCATNQHMTPYQNQHSRHSIQSNLDESIPVEAALAHHRHDTHTAQGLMHSISVSSTTSNFPRRNAKNGKRFEEKIQLQVIRYEIQDAHLISPHGPIGRLVLGTYHVVSLPRSARSIKAQGGVSRALARSGTVVVRRSRMEFGQLRSISPSRPQTPLSELSEDSSMLLTDAENQHTSEAAILKWYMTEIHWKREAALLKHLKSPIFVMELLESYCIPALQNRAHTYPFVNAMGGCSSLLSDVGPIKTAQHARSILRSISAAVDWCHRHGVVHLNIQPGSFFIEEGIDPKVEDAPWKLWDFTCARFIGEPIGAVGGGGGGGDENSSWLQGSAPGAVPSLPQPPPDHLQSEAYPYLEQRQVEERLDRIGGNPLPAAYTAPELLEAWRAGDTSFPAEAVMDTWSLGCVYYEVLSGGLPLFPTEAEAWGLVGGWDNQDRWTAKDFRVPFPPAPARASVADPESALLSTGPTLTSVSDAHSACERSQILDPSGSIAQLLHDMMSVHADERISLETIMERIY